MGWRDVPASGADASHSQEAWAVRERQRERAAGRPSAVALASHRGAEPRSTLQPPAALQARRLRAKGPSAADAAAARAHRSGTTRCLRCGCRTGREPRVRRRAAGAWCVAAAPHLPSLLPQPLPLHPAKGTLRSLHAAGRSTRTVAAAVQRGAEKTRAASAAAARCVCSAARRDFLTSHAHGAARRCKMGTAERSAGRSSRAAEMHKQRVLVGAACQSEIHLFSPRSEFLKFNSTNECYDSSWFH